MRERKNLEFNRNAFSEAVRTKNLLLSREVEEIDNDRDIVSHNYYGEILFDYLTIFYKKIGYSLNASKEQLGQMKQAVRDD
jgi:hypothetical protein